MADPMEAPEAAAPVRQVKVDEDDGDNTCLTLAIEGENDTLANALREMMWLHPDIEVASYTKEHPEADEVLVRCQTNGAVTATQGLQDALAMLREVLGHVGGEMGAAVERFWREHPEARPPPARDEGGGGGGSGGGGGGGGAT